MDHKSGITVRDPVKGVPGKSISAPATNVRSAASTANRDNSKKSHSAQQSKSKLNKNQTPEPSIDENSDEIPTEHEIAEALCDDIAEDLTEFALDVCFDRYVNGRAHEIIAWEFRDVILDITTMNWLDTEKCITDPSAADLGNIFAYGRDEPALPPKFDFWSHGALETLPNEFICPILDPFSRNSISVNLENVSTPTTKDYPSPDFMTLTKPQVTAKTPTPVETEEEDTWSTGTYHGSHGESEGCESDGGADGSWKESDKVPVSSATFARAMKAGLLDSTSIELLYPYDGKYPLAELKSSSEMAWKEEGPWVDGRRQSELIAFKLPNQTSSESLRLQRDREKNEDINKIDTECP